jgi:hypothetical protein
METQIITLRESIHTGEGLTKVLEVKTWWTGTFDEIKFELLDGSQGMIPFKNIAGIHPKKQSKG